MWRRPHAVDLGVKRRGDIELEVPAGAYARQSPAGWRGMRIGRIYNGCLVMRMLHRALELERRRGGAYIPFQNAFFGSTAASAQKPQVQAEAQVELNTSALVCRGSAPPQRLNALRICSESHSHSRTTNHGCLFKRTSRYRILFFETTFQPPWFIGSCHRARLRILRGDLKAQFLLSMQDSVLCFYTECKRYIIACIASCQIFHPAVFLV